MSSLLAVIAGAVGLGMLGMAGFWLRRARIQREQLDRELEILLPGTRVGPVATEAGLPPVVLPGTSGSAERGLRAAPQLRDQARDWVLRDTQRAALVLAAWASGAAGVPERQRHGQK